MNMITETIRPGSVGALGPIDPAVFNSPSNAAMYSRAVASLNPSDDDYATPNGTPTTLLIVAGRHGAGRAIARRLVADANTPVTWVNTISFGQLCDIVDIFDDLDNIDDLELNTLRTTVSSAISFALDQKIQGGAVVAQVPAVHDRIRGLLESRFGPSQETDDKVFRICTAIHKGTVDAASQINTDDDAPNTTFRVTEAQGIHHPLDCDDDDDYVARILHTLRLAGARVDRGAVDDRPASTTKALAALREVEFDDMRCAAEDVATVYRDVVLDANAAINVLWLTIAERNLPAVESFLNDMIERIPYEVLRDDFLIDARDAGIVDVDSSTQVWATTDYRLDDVADILQARRVWEELSADDRDTMFIGEIINHVFGSDSAHPMPYISIRRCDDAEDDDLEDDADETNPDAPFAGANTLQEAQAIMDRIVDDYRAALKRITATRVALSPIKLTFYPQKWINDVAWDIDPISSWRMSMLDVAAVTGVDLSTLWRADEATWRTILTDVETRIYHNDPRFLECSSVPVDCLMASLGSSAPWRVELTLIDRQDQ